MRCLIRSHRGRFSTFINFKSNPTEKGNYSPKNLFRNFINDRTSLLAEELKLLLALALFKVSLTNAWGTHAFERTRKWLILTWNQKFNAWTIWVESQFTWVHYRSIRVQINYAQEGSLSFQLLSLLNDFFIILILSSLTVKTWIRQPEKGKNDCTRVGWVFSAKSVTVLCMYGNSKKIRENGNLLLENYFKIQFSTSKIKRKKKHQSLLISLWF